MLVEIEVMVICIICAAVVLVSLINAISGIIVCNKMFNAMTEWFDTMFDSFKQDGTTL